MITNELFEKEQDDVVEQIANLYKGKEANIKSELRDSIRTTKVSFGFSFSNGDKVTLFGDSENSAKRARVSSATSIRDAIQSPVTVGQK